MGTSPSLHIPPLPRLDPRPIALIELITELFLRFTRVKLTLHGLDGLDLSSCILAPNHFTRFEVALVGKLVFKQTGVLSRYLADDHLFVLPPLRKLFLGSGAIPLKYEGRNEAISLDLALGGTWLIFPEGSMLKDKKIVDQGQFVVYSYEEGRPYRPPHTGTAVLAMEAQNAKQHLRALFAQGDYQAIDNLVRHYRLDPDKLYAAVHRNAQILPVNISYFPTKSPDHLAMAEAIDHFLPQAKKDRKLYEELVFDGSLLRYGVDIDVRFEQPIEVTEVAGGNPWLERIETVRATEKELAAAKTKAAHLMQLSMERIYRSTTVNANHLVSELLLRLLKDHHRSQLPLSELRQRLYLAIRTLAGTSGVYLHASLQPEREVQKLLYEPVFPLLDRFLAFCATKDLLTISGGELKLSERLLDQADFQSIRLVNPIRVASNELQPLQEVLDTIAWAAQVDLTSCQDDFAQDILLADDRAYLAEYRAERKAGRLVPSFAGSESLGAPIYLPTDQNLTNHAVLFLHGLGASPTQLHDLAAEVCASGLSCSIPRLPGHGTSLKQCALATWADWYSGARRAAAALAFLVPNISVIGYGSGALLAALLAEEDPRIRTCTLLAPTLEPDLDVLSLAGLLKRIPFRSPVLVKEEHPLHYRELPHAALDELRALIRETNNLLPRLRCPTLLVQANADRWNTPQSHERVEHQLNGIALTSLKTEGRRVGILKGPQAADITQAIIKHLHETPL